jgi:hypothetical protein
MIRRLRVDKVTGTIRAVVFAPGQPAGTTSL